MGTGGDNPKKYLVARLIEHLERGLVIMNSELGKYGEEPGKFRNTQVSGVYTYNYGGTEFEVTVRVKK